MSLRHVTQRCVVCKIKESKYTCPRCNVPYCSVRCYGKHGQNCTETFYREHVNAALKVQRVRANDEDAANVRKVLKEFYEDMEATAMVSRADEADTERLEHLSRLDDIDLTDLTINERRRFARAVRAGLVHVDTWTPWWVADGRPHVNVDSRKRCRAPRREPNARIRYHLVDMLFAYAFVWRLYNGNVSVDVRGAASALMDVSASFGRAEPESSSCASLASSVERLRRWKSRNIRDVSGETNTRSDARRQHASAESIGLGSDVILFLKSRAHVLCALDDLRSLFRAAAASTRVVDDERPADRYALRRARSDWKNAERKLRYFLWWASSCTDASDVKYHLRDDDLNQLYRETALANQIRTIEHDRFVSASTSTSEVRTRPTSAAPEHTSVHPRAPSVVSKPLIEEL